MTGGFQVGTHARWPDRFYARTGLLRRAGGRSLERVPDEVLDREAAQLRIPSDGASFAVALQVDRARFEVEASEDIVTTGATGPRLHRSVAGDRRRSELSR